MRNRLGMKRIAILFVIAVAPAIIFSPAGCSRKETRPSVVLVSLDTLRADRLGCYGYGKRTSSFLDRLAEEGVLFENAIAQSHWTLPSHVSMLTSLYPSTHLVQRGTEMMPPSLVTMAELLKGAGYETAAFTDGGMVAREYGFDQGFDLYDDRSTGAEKDAKVIEWLKKRNGHPFFLFYHTYDIHCPYKHHPRPRDLRAGLTDLVQRINEGRQDLSERDLRNGLIAFFTDATFFKDINLDRIAPLKDRIDEFVRKQWARLPEHEADRRYLSEAYDAGITRADRRLERLWERIRKAGLDENTLLIVTSDHGECLLDHGALGHPQVLADEILRVPLILRFPRLGAKRGRIPGQVMSIDILPTVLELAGLPVPATLQGRSLLPLMRGGEAGGSVYAESYDFRATRADGWKYIMGVARPEAPPEPAGKGRQYARSHMLWAGVGGRVADPSARELYSLSADPAEERNVITAEPGIAARLAGMLRRWEEGNEAARKELGIERAAARGPLKDETLERIKALGYMQ